VDYINAGLLCKIHRFLFECWTQNKLFSLFSERDFMKKIFSNYTQDSRISTALLLMRLVLGTGIALHGWGKIQNPTSWAGDGFPAALQALAAISEFGGGIGIALGALTVLSGFGLFCTMAVAVHMHAIVKGDPFVGKGGSYEPALIYLVFAVLIMLTGPGKFSIDQYLFKTKK
jgi:putative oxidoreductase